MKIKNKPQVVLAFTLALSYTVLISYSIQSKNLLPHHIYMGFRNAAHHIAINEQLSETRYGGKCGDFFDYLKDSLAKQQIVLHALPKSNISQYEPELKNPRSNGLWLKRKPKDIKYPSSSGYIYDLECGPNSMGMVDVEIGGERLGKTIAPSRPFYETQLRLIMDKKYAEQLYKVQDSEGKLQEEINKFELIAIERTTTAKQLESYRDKYPHIKITIIQPNNSKDELNLRTKAYNYLISEGERPKALITDSFIAISLYEKGVQENSHHVNLLEPLKKRNYTVFPTDTNIKLPGFTSEDYVLIARRDSVGEELIYLFNDYIHNHYEQVQKDLDAQESESLARIEEEFDSNGKPPGQRIPPEKLWSIVDKVLDIVAKFI